MNADELQAVLENHKKWSINNEEGKRAYLRGADLRGANLRDADLRDADLQDAYLRDANLRDANLQGADLRGAYLQDAYLRGADLRGANLRDADLRDADLRDADLRGAKLPHYQIPQHGELRVYKKASGKIVLLKIPSWAQRTAALVGRKCRASIALVFAIEGDSAVTTERNMTYEIGKYVKPDSYDPDPRVECSHGIHFFLTRAEAEEFSG